MQSAFIRLKGSNLVLIPGWRHRSRTACLPRMAYLGNNKNNKDVLRFKVERKQLSTDSRMETQVKDGLPAKDGLPRE